MWFGMRSFYVLLFLAFFSGQVLGEDLLAPPPGVRKLFEFSADGMQIYRCWLDEQTGKPPAFGWVFEAPDATLFDAQQQVAGTHFQGPSWKLKDGSEVSAEPIAKVDSPQPSSIPWLLLKVTTHQGKGSLDPVQFIRRVDTQGGTEPAEVCDAAHHNERQRIPYSATYEFFGP